MTRVLLCKRTANLLQAKRVVLSDESLFFDDLPEYGVFSIWFGQKDFWDGVIANNPSASGELWFFMNREWVQKEFEDLGEL